MTTFVWDGDALVGDWIEDPTDPVVSAKGIAREWVYYPETFEPLALLGGRSGPNTLLHDHNDPNGCPIRLTDSQGEVLWAASYTAWGQIARLHVGYVDNPIRLQGQYEDGETGLNYNRHRYYDSVIGSFVSADPIGLAGGANCYHYASNALSWIDPYGLSCKIVGGKYEYYYRAMSRADFEHFLSTGKLKATTETFISPTRKFSEAYKGVLVKFQLAEGTTQALRDIGVRAHGKKSEALLPDLPQVKKGWARSKALFKPEGDQINIGLGKGRALDVFNQGIRGFEILGVNR